MTAFVLRLLYTNVSTKNKSCKESLVGLGGSNSLKIIFLLLTKMVAVHVQLIIIYIQHFSLKSLLALHQKLFRSLVRLQVSLYEWFESFIGSNQSESWSRNQSGNENGTQRRITRWSGPRKGTGTTKREVLTRRIIKTGTFGSHLNRELD